MIVSKDSVNAIALPYVWQLTDNYGYTQYHLQTNTLSQTVAIHSWPDFDDLPRGQPKWERGQRCTRLRTRPRPDTTRLRPRPSPKNLALSPCWPRELNIPDELTQRPHRFRKLLPRASEDLFTLLSRYVYWPWSWPFDLSPVAACSLNARNLTTKTSTFASTTYFENIIIRLPYLRELLRRLEMITTDIITARTMTMPALTDPAIHATDNDNQLFVSAAASADSTVHVVWPGYRTKQLAHSTIVRTQKNWLCFILLQHFSTAAKGLSSWPMPHRPIVWSPSMKSHPLHRSLRRCPRHLRADGMTNFAGTQCKYLWRENMYGHPGLTLYAPCRLHVDDDDDDDDGTEA